MDTTELITKLQEVFAPVAAKIGTGAEYGWMVVMKQQYVWAWLGVFWAIVGVVSMGVSLLIIKTLYNNEKKHGSMSDSEGIVILLVICLVAIVASVIMMITGSITAITHFLNPDYYAIKFFLDLVNTNH